MKSFYNLILAIHIGGGFSALLTGLLAMFTSKGGKNHRLYGKLYFAGMTIVFTSSLFMTIAKPNPFLFVISLISYLSVAIGYRSLYIKKLHTGQQKAKLIDWIIGTGSLFFLATLALLIMIFDWQQPVLMPATLFVGVMCLVNSFIWMRSFYRLPDNKYHWYFTHIQGMGGGYIATSTAFLVTNVKFLPPIVVWVTPTVIGTAIITFVIAKYKRKFSSRSSIVS